MMIFGRDDFAIEIFVIVGNSLQSITIGFCVSFLLFSAAFLSGLLSL